MPAKHPIVLRKLLKIFKSYGIEPMEKEGAKNRGKGSEIILLMPNSPGSKQGPQYPIKNHVPNTEISYQSIDATLRRFNIDKKEFWKNN